MPHVFVVSVPIFVRSSLSSGGLVLLAISFRCLSPAEKPPAGVGSVRLFTEKSASTGTGDKAGMRRLPACSPQRSDSTLFFFLKHSMGEGKGKGGKYRAWGSFEAHVLNTSFLNLRSGDGRVWAM